MVEKSVCKRCNVLRDDNSFIDEKGKNRKGCHVCRAKGRRSRLKNLEKSREMCREWRRNNKERVKDYNKFYKDEDSKTWASIAEEKEYGNKSIGKVSPHRKQHQIIDGIEMKLCTNMKCDKKWQSLDSYYPNPKTWDKLRYYCRTCFENYREGNKERMTEYNKKYWIETKDWQLEANREWKKNNRERYREYMRIYSRKWNKIQRATNPQYRLTKNMRCRLYSAMKDQNAVKCSRTFDLVGCSITELKDHLESQFVDGMIWDNYGEWHIDHIRPCISFDLTKPAEQRKCFHFSNLQPLWALDNISKGGKWDSDEDIDEEDELAMEIEEEIIDEIEFDLDIDLDEESDEFPFQEIKTISFKKPSKGLTFKAK